MHVVMDEPHQSCSRLEARSARLLWLFLRTRPECEALLRRILLWDEATRRSRLLKVRRRLAATAGFLYSHPQQQLSRPGGGSGNGPVDGIAVCPKADLAHAGIGTLLGWLYVAEGARLHLHVLDRIAQRAGGRPIEPVGNKDVRAQWSAFATAAERVPLDAADLRDMLAGARSALRHIEWALEAEEVGSD